MSVTCGNCGAVGKTGARWNLCEFDHAPDCPANPNRVIPVRDLVDELTGALRFIMAFYEPNQRHLDTDAWQLAEANGRRALARGEAELADRAAGTVSADAAQTKGITA